MWERKSRGDGGGCGGGVGGGRCMVRGVGCEEGKVEVFHGGGRGSGGGGGGGGKGEGTDARRKLEGSALRK